MKKLAHLILAHANPLQVERLVNRLKSDRADIYIHLDKKSEIAAFAALNKASGVFFIKKRLAVGWGDYSMVQATLNAFEEILQTGKNYTHINLLSGQDYPLKNDRLIEDFLFANSDKTFMEWLNIEKDWPDGRTRLLQYSFGDYKFPGKYLLQNLANSLLPRRKMPGNLVPYGRSQWLTITPACAAYSLNYIKKHTKLKRYFSWIWGSDEVFFQTILVNSPLRGTLVNDNLRYIELGKERPRVFGIADAGLLLGSGKFFARKFDMSADSAILDSLDRAAAGEN